MSAPNGLSLLIRRGPARRRHVPRAESLERHAERGHTYRKRYLTRTIESFAAGYWVCRDVYSDGTERVSRPAEWQLERWLKGAVEL